MHFLTLFQNLKLVLVLAPRLWAKKITYEIGCEIKKEITRPNCIPHSTYVSANNRLHFWNQHKKISQFREKINKKSKHVINKSILGMLPYMHGRLLRWESLSAYRRLVSSYAASDQRAMRDGPKIVHLSGGRKC